MPLAFVACGPVGFGAGIASLLDDGGTGIDPTNVPLFEAKAHSLNDKGSAGIWAGPRIGVVSDPDPNPLPTAPYIEFAITSTNRPLDELTVFVKLASAEDFDDLDDDERDFLEVEPRLEDDKLVYLPRLRDMHGAPGPEFTDQVYRIQFRVVDKQNRPNTTPPMDWTFDATPPGQPGIPETEDIPRSADGAFLESVQWDVDGNEHPEIERYDILFLPDESPDADDDDADFDSDDLFDPLGIGQQSSSTATPDDIGIERVMNDTAAPGQTTGSVRETHSNVFVAGRQKICKGIHLAVVAVDFANNRSVVRTVTTVSYADGACKSSDNKVVANPAASVSLVNALDLAVPPDTGDAETHFIDMNGDGCLDIVTIAGDGTIRVAFAECVDGRPTGEYDDPIAADAPDFQITDATSFDLNDGGPAEILAISEPQKSIGLLALNKATGKYEPIGQRVELPVAADDGTPIRSEYTPVQIVTAIDVNRDAYDDILVRATHDGAAKEDFLVAYLGVGANGRASADLTKYRAVSTKTGLRARQALFGDFNADTLGDVALCDGEVVRLLLGAPTVDAPHRSTGGFDTKRIVTPTILELVDQGLAPPVVAGGPEFLAAADLNDDGIDDIVMSNAGGSISVLKGAADNDFGVPTTFSGIPPGSALAQVVSPGAGPVVIDDLNLDGILDIFVAGVAGNSISFLLGSGTDGAWDGTFARAVAFPVPFDPVAIAAGDLDGDGILDITVIDASGTNAAVLEGDGFLPRALGTFTAGPVLPLPLHTADRLVVLDLDGDAILDLVAAGMRGGAGIQTLFLGSGANGLGTGAFGPGLTRGIGDGPLLSLVTADFNRDNVPDLAGASVSGVDVQFGLFSEEDQRFLFESDDLYAFRPAPGAAADRIAQTIAGDFNSDGIVDLVSRSDDSLDVLLGKNEDGRTDGTFRFEYKAPADFLTASEELICGGIDDFTELLKALDTGLRNPLTDVVVPGAIGAADFDGDGGLDVVVVDEERKKLAILRNYGRDCGDGAGVDLAGFGMFEAPVFYPLLPFTPGALVVDDLNGDGVPDVAALAKNPGVALESFCVMLGARAAFADGDTPSLEKFSFGDPLRAGDGGDPSAIAAADLNQDGELDIIVADKTAGSITVYYGDGTGDYGSATTVTLTAPVGVAAPRALAVGDFNGDRVPDIAVGGDAGVQILYGDAGIR